MLLTEIRTDAEHEFLKMWYSCELMVWDEYPESLFMVRDGKVLFEQDWKNGFLWCKYSTVWSFFESKFGYNKLQISQMISGLLEEHLKKGVFTPFRILTTPGLQLEEHLKKGVLTPARFNSSINLVLEEHLKKGILTPKCLFTIQQVTLEEHLKNGIDTHEC